MVNQPLNLTKLKLNHKIILISAVSIILLILFLTEKKIFFFLTTTAISIALSLIIGYLGPMKLVGIELVTFSTILVGNIFGSVTGAIFGVSLFIIHLIAARYRGGPYLIWVLPTYALIGVLSGTIFDVKILVAMVIGVNILDNVLTFFIYRENFMKTFIFSIGNVVFNYILISKFLVLITAMT